MSGVHHCAAALVARSAELVSAQHTVVEVAPERGLVVLDSGGHRHQLHFDEHDLLALLDHEGGAGAVFPDVPALESAARLVSVHLDESLATRAPHPTGRWSYRSGGFDPIPPWEAFGR